MKTLIVYFSLSNTTRKAAFMLQTITYGDLFEIKSEKDYGGFIKAAVIGGKEKITNELPSIISTVDNIESYDRLLLGFPIWYGNYPPIIKTFINSYDLSGKDIYPFCTSGNTKPDKAQVDLATALPDSHVHTAMRFKREVTVKEIQDWLAK